MTSSKSDKTGFKSPRASIGLTTSAIRSKLASPQETTCFPSRNCQPGVGYLHIQFPANVRECFIGFDFFDAVIIAIAAPSSVVSIAAIDICCRIIEVFKYAVEGEVVIAAFYGIPSCFQFKRGSEIEDVIIIDVIALLSSVLMASCSDIFP